MLLSFGSSLCFITVFISFHSKPFVSMWIWTQWKVKWSFVWEGRETPGSTFDARLCSWGRQTCTIPCDTIHHDLMSFIPSLVCWSFFQPSVGHDGEQGATSPQTHTTWCHTLRHATLTPCDAIRPHTVPHTMLYDTICYHTVLYDGWSCGWWPVRHLCAAKSSLKEKENPDAFKVC